MVGSYKNSAAYIRYRYVNVGNSSDRGLRELLGDINYSVRRMVVQGSRAIPAGATLVLKPLFFLSHHHDWVFLTGLG